MRIDIPSWEEYFMNIADCVKTRSKDPRTQVGCVIVSPDKRIIATGYNGMATGCNESDMLWTREFKHNYVLHAEMNAIAHAVAPLKDATVYVTLHPCIDCAKMIVASGIQKVFYRQWRDTDYCRKARELLEYSNIDTVLVPPQKKGKQ